MISPKEAFEIIRLQTPLLPDEQIPLNNAANRVLREDCVADMDLPPFPRATMDGYAVRSADVAAAPTRLRVLGTIGAGSSFDRPLNQGETVKIMTGAPVPAGADAVQRVEVTTSEGDSVIIAEPVKPGQFITPAGREATRGQVVIKAGARLSSAEIAILATFGYAHVKVGRRPRVSVVATGSELVAVDETPGGAQIRNSNNYGLAAYAARAGALVTNHGIVADEEELLIEKIKLAITDCDVIMLSGGVSMGDFDLVKIALKKLDAEVFFEKVALKPGKPLVFGRIDGTMVFGLPGNPVSTAVTYNLFVRSALLLMMGATEVALPVVRAWLINPVKPAPERRSYLPGRLRLGDGRAEVVSLKWAGSSDLVGFGLADALIVVPPGREPLQPGTLVEVVLLER